jgi:hypothetical protein
MARILQTAVSDEIDALAFDDENREERRRESLEYQREIMGYYDEDSDPYDNDRDDYGPEMDYDDSCQDDGMDDVSQGRFDEDDQEPADDDRDYDGPEDFGWDGGMEP